MSINWIDTAVSSIATAVTRDERPGYHRVWRNELDDATGRVMRVFSWESDASRDLRIKLDAEYELRLTTMNQQLRSLETTFNEVRSEYIALAKSAPGDSVASRVDAWRQWARDVAMLRTMVEVIRTKLESSQSEYDAYRQHVTTQNYGGKFPR